MIEKKIITSLGAAQTLTPKLDHRPQNQPVLPPDIYK